MQDYEDNQARFGLNSASVTTRRSNFLWQPYTNVDEILIFKNESLRPMYQWGAAETAWKQIR